MANNVSVKIPDSSADRFFRNCTIVFISEKIVRPNRTSYLLHIKKDNGEYPLSVEESKMIDYIPNFTERLAYELKIAYLYDKIEVLKESLANC